MPRQLIFNCLNCVFEILEYDKNTLFSCLLVNRQWCDISVRILWRDVWNFQNDDYDYKPYVSTSIVNTLISCLPKESKDLLQFFIVTIIQNLHCLIIHHFSKLFQYTESIE
ncbi:hypothetical protein RhiirA5_415418 [Rhizophagus irregularis]|uniref:F-box domain-containing protein n=1 Tax=Rhizophagus irregularis TaxID=588596 RepID=A0A2N0PS14_9GLOM|nr:hypothetical protein RhiirA5_415418 [Rhizophagus irregularis]